MPLIAKTTTTTTTSNSGGGSSLFLLVIIGLFVVFYFAVMRPNQKRRMQAMRQSRAFQVGDEVVAGGMVGRVESITGSEVDVEVADGVVIKFVSQAVQSRASYNAAPAGRGGAFGARGGFASASTGGLGGGSSMRQGTTSSNAEEPTDLSGSAASADGGWPESSAAASSDTDEKTASRDDWAQ